MAITYKDSKRAQSKRSGAGPILVAMVVLGGLLLLGPHTTAMLEDTLATVLRLPLH